MNIASFLLPKVEVTYLYDHMTLRQGLEKMRAHGYTAIPVINADGEYVGTVNEGDFLYNIIDKGNQRIKDLEHYYVRDIIREDFNPAVKINVSMDELLQRAMKQNFIPVTDARGSFIGIVTRQDIIKYFTEMPHSQ